MARALSRRRVHVVARHRTNEASTRERRPRRGLDDVLPHGHPCQTKDRTGCFAENYETSRAGLSACWRCVCCLVLVLVRCHRLISACIMPRVPLRRPTETLNLPMFSPLDTLDQRRRWRRWMAFPVVNRDEGLGGRARRLLGHVGENRVLIVGEISPSECYLLTFFFN